ncbi:hypothetical protein JL100_036235 (plasmid) [Skermanella mucosa]|uniref:hypothetical protein n=1 Tax=Skermanella mucosa TaxID=1789672 RepID=UPI00192AACA9|nr:hypothetical protein [Skermanella mucosa]UEM25229.1 hypothetical protein JL100_036235 [Skermanella mucosa]
MVGPDWFELYGPRVEQYRLPKGDAERAALADRIGADGYAVLAAVFDPSAPAGLRALPAVETLRQAWVHQYRVADGAVRLVTQQIST